MTSAPRTLARRTARDVPSVTFSRNDDTVVVVIGSGAGGGTLANELSQNGVNVVLLEAGQRFHVEDFVNDEWEMWDRLTWKDQRDASGSSPVAQNFPDAPTWLCKGLGGTTLHWSAECPRLAPYEFKALTTYGPIEGANLADWPVDYEEIEPFYIRAEKRIGVSGQNGIPHHKGSTLYQVMALGAERVGYTDYDPNGTAINPVPYDGRNACDQIGFCMQGCTSGAKWSTFNTEIPRAEATGRCEVRTHSMVVRIELDDAGRVSEVLYFDGRGELQRQKCRLLCVAGNAIETPRLLLNSESNRCPDGLANSSGMVGRNYMRHVTGYLYSHFDHPIHMNRGRVVGGIIRDERWHDESRGFAGGYLIGIVGLGLPFYAAFKHPGAWGRDYARSLEGYAYTGGLHYTGEDLPIQSNGVSLHPTKRDQFGLPIPSLHIDDHPNDLAMKEHGNARMLAVAEAAGARDSYLSPPLPASHNLGTCRMSDDPATGVVDRWGRAHDVPNLFISDGSQFTTSMAPNPTLLIVTLAIRQAGYIVERMRRGEL